MAWLLRQGEVLASLELASTPGARLKGFCGRKHDQGALLVAPSRAAHSLGSRCSLDIAFLDPDYVVLELTSISSNRIVLPRRGCAAVLQAEAGAFERWRLQLGDHLEITD